MNKEVGKKRSITVSDKNAIYNILADCYRAGVRDAEYVNDAGRCREFIEATKVPNVYGRVIYDVYWDWRKWRSAIINMRNDLILGEKSIFYVYKIISPHNYYACLLPLAQWFYHQGLNDWNNNPTLHIFDILNSKNVRWTSRGYVKRTRKMMFAQLQEFAFEIGTIGEAAWKENKKVLRPIHFEWFCSNLWQVGLSHLDKIKLAMI